MYVSVSCAYHSYKMHASMCSLTVDVKHNLMEVAYNPNFYIVVWIIQNGKNCLRNLTIFKNLY